METNVIGAEGQATQGEKVQEAAAPAENTYAQGEKAQEAAAPAPREQSAEDNARFAAARRKAEAERDAAVARAQARAEAYVEEKLRASGLADRRESPGTEESRAAARARIREDMEGIRAIDPNIRGPEDLAGMENFAGFCDLVRRGYSLLDAYECANRGAVRRLLAENVRQSVRNASLGKAHLAATASRGTGAVCVPAEVKDMYRAMMPEVSEAEMQTHYNKTRKA